MTALNQKEVAPTHPSKNAAKDGEIEHRSATELAAGYSNHFRYVEYVALTSFIGLSIFHVYTFSRISAVLPVLVISVFIFGMVLADFVSGFVHWAADTWGSPDWPIVGQSLIRTFREHHVDPKSITRHDFVEVNASNSLVSLPIMIGMVFFIEPTFFELDYSSSGLIHLLKVSIYLSMISLCLWVFLTNQIHKWAHQDHPNAVVRILQKSQIILSPESHDIHHRAPFISDYCITTGWLNPILTWTQFFRHMEHMITWVTGALPREDDIGKKAAKKTV